MKIATYIREYLSNWSAASKRFPVFLLWVSALCVYFCYRIVSDVEPDIRILWTLALAALFSLNISLFTALKGYSGTVAYLCQLVSPAFTLIFYTLLPAEDAESTVWAVVLFAVLMLIFHLTLSLLPFLKARNESSFLTYNMKLLENMAESLLMAGILFLGLSLAVVSIDALFNTTIGRGEMYGHLAIWIFLWLNSLNFVSSFPSIPVTEEKADTFQSRFFRIFVNYICIPVTLIYALILYAYTVKVMFDVEAIKIWTSSMCTWYFGVGIFSYLTSRVYLLHNNSSASQWFVKYFYHISIVPLILYMYAGYRFIIENGITEESYYLVLAIVFATLSLVYMLGSKVKDQRFYGASMIVLATISVVTGPWNVWNLSLSNQQDRLVDFLEERGNLRDGMLVKGKSNAKPDGDQVLRETLMYLDQRFALDPLKERDKEKILGDSITLNSIGEALDISGLSSRLSPKEEVKSVFWPHLPVIDLKGTLEMRPVQNKYVEIKADYKGYKVTDHGTLAYYESGKLVNEMALTVSNLKSDHLLIMQDNQVVKVYFTNLNYREDQGKLALEDVVGTAIVYAPLSVGGQ
ncbi:MAG: DUF4153 domain-containing protein [Saprospiraceae bacterium]|nr:DUF4153 domain-containing protein [Saprospiraceae bacterium]